MKNREDTIASKRKKVEATNLTAASLIAADPAKHGGLGSLAVQWALAVLKRQPAERKVAA
jgi:hypothetical protein